MVQDRIEREILIAASPERVWEIITEAEHVGKWFGDSADVDLRPGGSIVLRWKEYGAFYGTIEKIDPPHYFSYRWVPGVAEKQPSDDNSTLVEFTLTPQGAQTQVRVVETGFGRLPMDESARAEQVEDNTEGWTKKLAAVRQYVEQLPV